jgi:predicted lipoprotein
MKQTTIFKTCMTAPTINNNGTSGKELLGQIREAYSAVEAAIDALRKAAPNGRDYQTAPEGSFEAAREAYHARLQALSEIRSDLFGVGVQIARQAVRVF